MHFLSFFPCVRIAHNARSGVSFSGVLYLLPCFGPFPTNHWAFTLDVPEWGRQDWGEPERAFARSDDGQPLATLRQVSRLEATLGSKQRSGGQLAIWDATFGPVGNDGYPQPLFDESTGAIDHNVVLYMRNHGYDLRYYAQTHWAQIGRELAGKLHLACGDMDNFYLNLGVYLFAQFLEKVDSRDVEGSIKYGRPLKGHGWQPMTNAQLVRQMAERVAVKSPNGESTTWIGRGF